jgi:hypothetical protein
MREMSARTHRGAHPEDRRLFGPEALPRLRVATEEVAWLLGRGYPMSLAIETVGNHHQLEARQRIAVQRSACSDAQRTARRARCVPAEALRGRVAQIDGFNLLITLEVAHGGGVLLRGCDGALRDLAGLRGSYAPIAATDAALDQVREALAAVGPRAVRWLLDAVVSNSGRLRARILERLAGAPFKTTVNLVPDPDVLLAGATGVISSDALVLDRCSDWISLASEIIGARLPGAWVVELG